MTEGVPDPALRVGDIDAVIFDTDGVITDTASLHAAAWKQVFDDYLRERAARTGEPFAEFDIARDYLRYVDGKPRQDGVAAFLASRGIRIAEGEPGDAPERETVHGIGSRKDAVFVALLRERGVHAYPSTIDFIRRLRELGVRTAAVSASRHCREVLHVAGVEELFDTVVDGVEAARLGLAGKPDPALFVEAASRLAVAPSRAAVIEDAQAGVEAGRRGGFALVIGVDRAGQARELSARGASFVVEDLSTVRILDEPPQSRRARPVNGWSLVYEEFDPPRERLREALCTLGNGYVATRGAAPESTADDTHYPGTYFAGCYNRLTSQVAGREVENEDLVNAPNWLPLTFQIEGGPWFDLSHVELLEYRQELNLRRGVLARIVRLRDPEGRETTLHQQRLVSMDDPHLAGLETTFRAENWSGRIRVRSALDGQVRNCGVARYRMLNGNHLVPLATGTVGEDVIWLQVETATSGIRIAEAARTRVVDEELRLTRETHEQPGWIGQDLDFDLTPGRSVTVEKIVALYTSRDRAIAECDRAACTAAVEAPGFDELLKRHVLAWDHLWRHADLRLTGDAGATLNLHEFHLMQVLAPHIADLDVGVPARGLHGEAYRGHVFWDELFVLPALNFRFPEVARSLLRYRWRRLPAARRAAAQAGHRGAMFPWQSGSDGSEETQRLHLNPRSGRWLPDHSRLQRHVGAAIAYNVWHHFQATGDLDYLCGEGGDLLIEIARFWSSIARYDKALGRYEITGVVGPDEYHEGYPWASQPGLANNAYTNVMAVWVLRRALDLARILPAHRSAALFERLALHREELELFEDITRKMRVCFHGDGIISQFEDYDKLDELDWDRYRAKYGDIRRLDRILEAEGDTTNRYKASKQADVLMLFYLFSVDELWEMFTGLGYPFDADLLRRNVEYYLQRTSHGSTLSSVVHSWVLSRANRPASWRFFTEALASDLHDVQGGTTAEGIHLGAMAGTVDLVQRCFTGLEIREGVLWLNPSIPPELGTFSFEIRYRGRWGVGLQFEDGHVLVSLPAGETSPIQVGVRGRVVTVEPGCSVELSV